MPDKKLTIQNDLGSLLHKGVDHVIAINQNGRAELVFSRSKINLSKERQEIFFMGFRLRHSLLQEFNDEFGLVNSLVIHRGNAKLISVPFDSYNIVMIMKNDTDHEFLIKEIKEIEECNHNISEPELICMETMTNG